MLPEFDRNRYYSEVRPPERGRYYLQDGVYFGHDGTPTAYYDKATGIETPIGEPVVEEKAEEVVPIPHPRRDRRRHLLPADWAERDHVGLRLLALDYGYPNRQMKKAEAYAFLETIHDEQRARASEQRAREAAAEAKAAEAEQPQPQSGGVTWADLAGANNPT